MPGKHIDKVIGIITPTSTRVGGGPFLTEQDNEIGQLIRDRGNEYGTVTAGRGVAAGSMLPPHGPPERADVWP